MSIDFLDSGIDNKSFLKPDRSGINPFLLENNTKQINEIIQFFQGENKLLLVNGFLGTGKTRIVDHAAKFLNTQTVTLKYNCFETTILDDILLSFFDDFKNLTVQNIIRQPRAKYENFTQKVEAYFDSIENPVLIIINSFESVLKDNKQEILDFLFHLASRKNIKIILIARVFSNDDFEGKISYSRVNILALDKSIFEKFLRSQGIKLIGPVSDELYKYSRGYFFYTNLTTKIINARKLSLFDFLKGYTKSFLSYNDFILREAMSFVDPVSGHLFRFLTIMRHPVNLRLLMTIGLYNEDRIRYFLANEILSAEKSMVYLQDYFKEISQNSISDTVAIKLHKACVDLYNTQLPLKPFERDLLISRQTMRSEIEYHSMFIPQKPFINPVSNAAIRSAGYAAETLQHRQEEHPTEKQQTDTKEEKIKNITFIFDSEEDEQKVLTEIAESINKFIDYSNKTLTPEDDELSLTGLLNAAKNAENEYNYKKAVAYCQRALLLKDDDDFYTLLPAIYTKLAQNYQQLSDWFNSLRYYDLALEFYTSASDIEKINEMKLSIANIFYITFKHDKAKLLLKDILETQNISNELKIKANLAMGALSSDDIRTSYVCYKTALSLIEPLTDKKVLAELYFKYALCCDDLDETETAVIYYKKCIDIDKNNPHLSSAMSNLALIFDETDMPELARKYYAESLKIDEDAQNNNGIYISSMKLAELNRSKSPEKTVEYYQKAINSAKALNEVFYLTSAYLELGDFYSSHKKIKFALKNYLHALNSAQNHFSQDNISKIEQRITDIKIRLGSKYDELEKEIKHEN